MRALLASLFLVVPLIQPALADPARHTLGDMVGHTGHNPHILLSPTRPADPGDRARAQAIARTLRATLERYRDVRAAEADGYRRFGPPTVAEVHYYHPRRSFAERRGINPARPSNLLYAPMPGGGMRLIGAMFTAPAQSSLEELNARVPLSQTRWHLHTNICLPRPVTDRRAWARRDGQGRMLFGPRGAIATQAACRAEGGRFHPTLFGWMVHVYPFRSDPDDWWMQHHG